MREPVLAATSYQAGVPMVFKVLGGLRHLSGNPGPYFSLTFEEHRKGFPNQRSSGGADHEAVLKRFPQFADLAALHLCGLDGSPNLSNAWYWYAGALGGAGERYHGANDGRHDAEACVAIFAKTVRIDAEAAAAMVAQALDRPALLAWCDAQRPRWQAEAEASRKSLRDFAGIARHKLAVFGDPPG